MTNYRAILISAPARISNQFCKFLLENTIVICNYTSFRASGVTLTKIRTPDLYKGEILCFLGVDAKVAFPYLVSAQSKTSNQ